MYLAHPNFNALALMHLNTFNFLIVSMNGHAYCRLKLVYSNFKIAEHWSLRMEMMVLVMMEGVRMKRKKK